MSSRASRSERPSRARSASRSLLLSVPWLNPRPPRRPFHSYLSQQEPPDADETPSGVCLHRADRHPGVLGDLVVREPLGNRQPQHLALLRPEPGHGPGRHRRLRRRLDPAVVGPLLQHFPASGRGVEGVGDRPALHLPPPVDEPAPRDHRDEGLRCPEPNRSGTRAPRGRGRFPRPRPRRRPAWATSGGPGPRRSARTGTGIPGPRRPRRGRPSRAGNLRPSTSRGSYMFADLHGQGARSTG